MTLTTPNCPMGQVLPEACRRMVTNMTGAPAVTVHLAWEPAWSPERISESGRQQLGMPAS
jgi:metal-sulfur cluster biosynthetic enzyme